MVTVVSKVAQHRVITVENRVQPPTVNDSAIRSVPGVCRMLAGAEMQKDHAKAQPRIGARYDLAVYSRL